MQHHETTPLIALSHGKGAYLYDMDGRAYLDAISSWWVNLFGHANPRINTAIKKQVDTLEHVMLAGFTHTPVIELSERLRVLTNNQLGHSFYASDGASAVEIALKMSLHSWRNAGQSEKQEFVCLQGSYHGETVGALAVTDVSLFRDAYGPMLQKAHVIPSPDFRQAKDGQSAHDLARQAAQHFETLLQERAGKIAAIIVEPLVQCATGMAMYDPLYLQLIRALCDRYHVHLIADEIAVGCGRSGKFFACEHAQIWPDFLCLSKGISGGYLPLSIVLTTESIYQSFYDVDLRRAFLHSHSYTGNPLACSAALATLDIFQEDQVLHHNVARADIMRETLMQYQDRSELVHLRSQGMILAFDVNLASTKTSTPGQFSRRYFAAALEKNVLLRPIGQTVYLMPPYILEEAELRHLVHTSVQLALDVAHQS